MCCQPPKLDDDLNYFYRRNLELIDTAPKELDEIGITGGEPTLLKKRFFELLQHINIVLPDTYIHVLSNGRKFAELLYCSGFLNVNRNNLLVGIPLHSDFSGDHDKITRIKNSFNETMKGLYNLGRLNIPIELRIVINKMNLSACRRCPDLYIKICHSSGMSLLWEWKPLVGPLKIKRESG